MAQLTVLKAILLGAVQGATEFLPVSSSGHLVIAQGLLGIELEGGSLLAFDVCLHFGTLLAVIAVFWRDIVFIFRSMFNRSHLRGGTGPTYEVGPVRQGRRLALFILLGTFPAVIIGLSLKDIFESLVTNPLAAACMLLVTGAILWCTRFVRRDGVNIDGMKWWQSLVVGVAQALAIVPGISRSGSTIAVGMYTGLDKSFAAKFSFLLAIPAIAGAMVLSLDDLASFSSDMIVATVVGTIVAAVVGYACIKWLLNIIKKGRLNYFAYYCWAVGIATILWSLL